MSKSPAFQFYPADYLADANVDMMTLEQQGAYVRLLCHAWRSTTVGRLLNDPQRLSSLARMSLEQWSANSAAILRAFRVDPDGYITQKRLVEEWEKQQARYNQCVAAGKNSAKKRLSESQRPLNERSTHGQREGNSSSSYGDICTGAVSEPPPVELPPGMPRSEKEAVAWAISSGVPEKFIKESWNDAVGVGGKDSGGRDIKVWAKYVKGRYDKHLNYQEEKKNRENHRRGNGSSNNNPSRNEGTHNEGRESQYENVGRVVPVSDAERPTT